VPPPPPLMRWHLLTACGYRRGQPGADLRR
jgi:hypothetical protein